MRRRSGRARAAAATVRALALRPQLLPEAVATARRLAPPGWWRRYPFLPVPDPSYWRFRMHTAYGADWSGRPTTSDVVDYLQWCQRARPEHR
jgi:hypothetical protein